MLKINQKIPAIVKQSLHYLAGNVAAKIVQFFSIVVFTRILSPSEYGSYNVFIGYAGIFVILLTLNSHTAVSRYFYENLDDFDKFTGSTIAITLFIIFCGSVTLLLIIPEVSEFIRLPKPLIILFIPFALIEFAILLLIQILQPRRKTKDIAVLSILRAVLSLALSYIFSMVANENRVQSIIVGYLTGGAVAVSYAFASHKNIIKMSVNYIHFKYIFNYTSPLIIYSLTTIILTQSDRLMIDRLSSAENAGLYSLAANLSMIIVVVYSSLLSAWTPNYYEGMSSNNFSKLTDEVHKILRFSAFAATILILFAGEVGRLIFPASYHPGLALIPILVFGYFLDLGWQIYGRHFGFAKKTIYITVIGLFTSVINVSLNSYFIPKFGYAAAAATTATSYGIMLLITVYFTKYLIRVYPYPIALMYAPVLIVAFAGISCMIIELQDSLMIRIAVKSVIFLLLFTAIWFKDFREKFKALML